MLTVRNISEMKKQASAVLDLTCYTYIWYDRRDENGKSFHCKKDSGSYPGTADSLGGDCFAPFTYGTVPF